eukprot:SM000959S24666  [mRNA]  locus=s959:21:2257:+ [translate_table: standard]
MLRRAGTLATAERAGGLDVDGKGGQAAAALDLHGGAAVTLLLSLQQRSLKKDGKLAETRAPEHSDAARARQLWGRFGMGRGALSAARPWSLIEQEGLAAGVRWQAQQRLASEAMQQLRKRGAYTRVELAATIARAAAEDPAWQRSAAALDWAAVAAAHVAGRSARECRLQWTNRLDPAINSSPWTEEEEAALQRIAEAAGLADWAAIASELGTGRTAWACLTHYRRAVSPASDGSRGTPASLLADEAVTAAQPEDRNDGSSHSGGTAEDQDQPATTGHADEPLVVQQLGCAVPLPPSPPQPPGPAPRRQNKWTAEEDRRLIYAVRTYGQQKWRKIAVHVPGRSDTQCRERWHNVLNPEVDRGDWTPDEDQLLENAVAAVGLHSWSAVAQLHNTLRVAAAGCGRCGHGDAGRLRRTDNICWRRWKSLSRRSPVLANGGDDGIGVEGAKEQRQQRRRKAESCERRRRKKEPEEQPSELREEGGAKGQDLETEGMTSAAVNLQQCSSGGVGGG